MIFEKNELQPLIQKRMPYHHVNVPFAVLWANKAGCTSVFKWFLWHAGLLEEAQDYGKTQDLTAIEPHHRQQRTPLYDLPNAVHYRLEDFSSAIEILEHRFKLDNSRPDTGQFSSPHHIKKYSVDQKAILKLLERGISLNRSPGYLLPDLTRDMLEGTPYGERIKSIFQDDIAFYEGIEPHDNHIPVASGAFPGKTR